MSLAWCQLNSCHVWLDSTEIAQYTIQLAAFQKPLGRFKEMAIFNGVTYEDVKESFQATIRYTLTYFSNNVANPIDFSSSLDPQKE